MPNIPLVLRMKRAQHKEIAEAQDRMIEALYEVFPDAVLHGGTSIWRCYQGNRFSEDIDVYLAKDLKKVGFFFKLLEKKGFIVEKRKVGDHSIFSKIRWNNALVRFEVIFKKVHASLKEYERIEGNFLTIYTLTPEELIQEKTAAYRGRLKIRDLYDIFFLLRYVQDSSKVKEVLSDLLMNFKSPVDGKDLRVLILEGIIPSVEKMIEYIKRRV